MPERRYSLDRWYVQHGAPLESFCIDMDSESFEFWQKLFDYRGTIISNPMTDEES